MNDTAVNEDTGKSEKNEKIQQDLLPPWERHGVSQPEYYRAMELSHRYMQKLYSAENKMREANELLRLLDGDQDLNLGTVHVIGRAQSLLKSAIKKVEKYSAGQLRRDIESASGPRNLELDDVRAGQQKQIVELLLDLSDDEAGDACSTYASLVSARQSGNTQLERDIRILLNNQPVSRVNAFAHMARDGLVRLSEEAGHDG